MSVHPPESGIPLLTEVLPAPIYGVDLPERRFAPPTAIRPALDMAQRERIAESVREAVLRDVMGRVDMLLALTVRDHLSEVLQTAVDGLASQLKGGLQQVLGQVLAEAVAHELEQYGLSEK
ncbi:MAG: hypothetical protein NVSMB6_24860 [Burkholderiaceae bacterium]